MIGPPLWVNNWRLISWRILLSTPARVDSKDCWLPLVDRIASMLDAVGGAAKAVAAVKERMRVRSFKGRAFIFNTFKNYELKFGYVMPRKLLAYLINVSASSDGL